jgi:sulfite exporter TauE/SafE
VGADPTGIYLQLLAIGMPWMLLHCPAMCGPLVIGLGLGCRHGCAASASTTLADLARYQLGKAVVLAAAGAALGGLGASLSLLRSGGVILAAVVAMALVAAAIVHLRPLAAGAGAGWLARGCARVGAVRAAHPGWGTAALGALLAGLPCGIVLWALALAAATASPLHGALVMAALPVMTTVPLAAVALLPRAARRFGLRAPRWLVPCCLLLSAAITLALAIGAVRTHPSCPLCVLGHG